MRNSDYVGLKGKIQEFTLNDEILSINKYEVPRIQTKTPLFNWVLDDKSKQSISFQIIVSSSIKLSNKNMGTCGILVKLIQLIFQKYTVVKN